MSSAGHSAGEEARRLQAQTAAHGRLAVEAREAAERWTIAHRTEREVGARCSRDGSSGAHLSGVQSVLGIEYSCEQIDFRSQRTGDRGCSDCSRDVTRQLDAAQLTGIRRGELPAPAATLFTCRIATDAKAEIRDQLERKYGFRTSTMYSD